MTRMEKINDVGRAEAKVLADIKEFLHAVRLLSEDVDSLSEGISRLREIRRSLYESLNQIQHEHLVLQGILWLREHGYGGENLQWYWNPRQTGDSNEPDLMAKDEARVVVCGEATTSENPVGIIDTRVRDTLFKLSRMEGDRFYFVRTSAMAERARTKLTKNSWRIEVVLI